MCRFALCLQISVLALVCASSIVRAQQQSSDNAEKNVEQYLVSLKTGTMCERRAAVSALHQMGKKAIPVLIAHISDAEIAKASTLMLANPLLSYVPRGSLRDEYSGVIYAYAIELILARDALHTGAGDCMFLLDNGDYAYSHGLIMKGQNVIGASDLERVKELYSQWWKTHRNEDLVTLQRDWSKSLRPLGGSAYHWL
jgi:hypothetical protein